MKQWVRALNVVLFITSIILITAQLLLPVQHADREPSEPLPTRTKLPHEHKLDAVTSRIYAHRGLSYFAPENTALAIELALARGFKRVEIDIVPTKEERFAVFHDVNLQRMFEEDTPTCDESLASLASRPLLAFFLREIFALPKKQIRKLEESQEPWINTLAKARIESLETILAHPYPQATHFHLDLKQAGCKAPSKALRNLVQTIRTSGRKDSIIIESTNLSVLRHLRNIDTEIALMYWDAKALHDPTLLETLRELDIKAIDLDYRALSLDASLPEGFQIYTFTINSFPVLQRYLDKADFILTDLDFFAEDSQNQYSFINSKLVTYEILDPSNDARLVKRSSRKRH